MTRGDEFMKTAAIIILSIGVGWFLHDTAVTATERINDWRTPAKWAGLGALEIILVLILFP